MRLRGPLADSYSGAAAMVVLSLIPYLILTSAMQPLQPLIEHQLGMSPQAMQNTTGMANAAYAFGTVLAVQLALRLPPRRLVAGYSTLLLVASVSVALAPDPAVFIAGHVIQGLCTSLLLIGAVPSLVTGWPTRLMPITAGLMNMCIFGAVALGPVVGGVEAGAGAWRPLFWGVTGVVAIAWLMVLLTYEDAPATKPPKRWDPVTLTLAGGGCAAAFFGASELSTHPMVSVIVMVPLLGGASSIVLLVAHQAVIRDPLIPVRELLSTLPVAGVLAAMAAGAASVAAVTLVETATRPTGSPESLAMLFWPFFGAALVTAVIFALVLRTRLLMVVAFAGLGLLAGGVAVMTAVGGEPRVATAVGSGLVGAGVGASVAPAMFVAGYSLRARYIQRVFALIELLRAVAAFMTAPILLHLALTTDGGSAGSGIRIALWVCFAIAGTGMLLSLYLLLLGRVRLQRPDLELWQQGGEPAWESPPLAAGIRQPAGGRDGLRTNPASFRGSSPG